VGIKVRRGMFETELADLNAVKEALTTGNLGPEDEVWDPLAEKWGRLSDLLALPTSPRGPATSPAVSGSVSAGATVTAPGDTVAAARRRQLMWAVSGVAAVALLVVVGLLAFARGKGTAPATQPVVQADVPLVPPQDVQDPVPPPIVAATCGNGIVETGEECDGSAQRPCPAGSGTQACTGTCTWGPCVTTACDGGYFDAGSGLCWQNPPTDRQLDWASATAYCRALDVGGFGPGSWRLPTINELRSLIRGCPATESGGSCGVTDSCCSASCVHPNGDMMTNVSCWAPGCGEAHGGPGAGGAYWPAELRGPDGIYFTSSLCPGCSPQFSRGEPTVWCVIFERAKVSDYVKTMEASVRCVRRPQDTGPTIAQGGIADSTTAPLPAEIEEVPDRPWSPTQGPADASITVVVFCEYLCPFCKRLQPTLRALRTYYPDDVRVVFRQHLVHPPAEPLSLAALAATRQGKFEELHALFFDNQREVQQACYQSADTCKTVIDKYAHQVPGLDFERFDTDFAGTEVRREFESDAADARIAGAGGTPSTYINGRLVVGVKPPTYFGNWIDQLLGRATTTIPSSADPQVPPRTQP
jgi:protein-disulfide isomerase